jgi:putative ABC transport system substrate-binding protein
MYRIASLTILALLFVKMPAAHAFEVLAVQNCRAKPYAEALQGFKSVCKASVDELVISELNGEDPVSEIRRRKPDLILAIGMDALLKIRKIREKPIVYLMVLHPDTAVDGEKNITGIRMTIAPERQLSIMRRVLPQVKKIGLVYSPKNSGHLVERASRASSRSGIELTSLKAKRPEDFPGLLRTMKGHVDAYWMLPDSAAITPEIVEDLILFSMQNRIPVFTFSDKYLRMGAFMSIQINAFKLGKQAGVMVGKILSGTPVSELPEMEAMDAVLTINFKVAEKMDIHLMNEVVRNLRTAK